MFLKIYDANRCHSIPQLVGSIIIERETRRHSTAMHMYMLNICKYQVKAKVKVRNKKSNIKHRRRNEQNPRDELELVLSETPFPRPP